MRKYFWKPRFIKLLLIYIIPTLLIYFRNEIYLRYYVRCCLDQDAILKSESRDFRNAPKFLEYNSKCKCRQNESIYLSQHNDYYKVTLISTNEITHRVLFEYNIDKTKFEASILTCDMYNSLRRGPHLKVLAYSLYGKKQSYYNFINELAMLIKKYYPNWIMRIYYDRSIDMSIICEIECLMYDEKSKAEESSGSKVPLFLDNVDFCDIENIPYDTSKWWNASYMHGMSWRWLPIGDSFVDFFGSRDTDVWLSKREVNSVNVWLNSTNTFHIMRDHPMHNIPIIGGLWGFANVRNQQLSKHLFKILTNKHIAKYYNPYSKSLKGWDQYFLTKFFAQYSYVNSTIHDSYNCYYLGGDAWPVQRTDVHCFVGCSECCDQSTNRRLKSDDICPEECRPKQHPDWIYC